MKSTKTVRIISVLCVVMVSLLTVQLYGARSPELKLSVSGAVLMEPETGKVLYAQDSHKRLVPASLVKLMTLLLTLEFINQTNMDVDTPIVISRCASRIGGRQVYLKEGETLTVGELIKSTAVFSANDAAFALAELVAGSEEQFVKLMNKKAQVLGLKDTHFYNSHGLPENKKSGERQYTSAWDMAQLARYLYKAHPEIFDYTSIKTDSIRNGAFSLVNTNKLLWRRDDVFGLKTGYVRASGFCVVNVARRDSFALISVVMGAPNKQARFNLSSRLLDFGFDNYSFIQIEHLTEPKTVMVVNGMEPFVPVVMEHSVAMVVAKGSTDYPKIEISLPEKINAPVKLNQHIGFVSFLAGEDDQIKVPLVTAEAVGAQLTAKQKIKRFLLKLRAKLF